MPLTVKAFLHPSRQCHTERKLLEVTQARFVALALGTTDQQPVCLKLLAGQDPSQTLDE